MKKVTTILAALFVATIFTVTLDGCGKYEEGPSFTVKSKKGRLAREWVGDVSIDGATGTSAAITSDDVYEYTKDGTVTVTSGILTYSGTWEFSGDKGDILTTFDFGGGITTTTTTKIIRLTSSELWTQDTDGTNDETRFKAK
jgi:hypothetical protein